MKLRDFLAGLMSLLILSLLSPTARAIDPLPPEIEKATPEKRSAYWQKISRESGDQKLKIAKQRYEKALERKHAMLNDLSNTLAASKAEMEEAQSGSSLAPAAEEPGTSTFGIVLVLVALLGGGACFMHRQLKESATA